MKTKMRDGNVLKSFKREINLRERVIKKEKYSRKEKHKKCVSEAKLDRQ